MKRRREDVQIFRQVVVRGSSLAILAAATTQGRKEIAKAIVDTQKTDRQIGAKHSKEI